MSIKFIPLGIPFSSSFAVSASYVATTSLGGVPLTASLVEFASLPVGPPGLNARTTGGRVD